MLSSVFAVVQPRVPWEHVSFRFKKIHQLRQARTEGFLAIGAPNHSDNAISIPDRSTAIAAACRTGNHPIPGARLPDQLPGLMLPTLRTIEPAVPDGRLHGRQFRSHKSQPGRTALDDHNGRIRLIADDCRIAGKSSSIREGCYGWRVHTLDDVSGG